MKTGRITLITSVTPGHKNLTLVKVIIEGKFTVLDKYFHETSNTYTFSFSLVNWNITNLI